MIKRKTLCAIAALCITSMAHAQADCLPIQAGGTGTNYIAAMPEPGQVAVWKCGNFWRWVGTADKGLKLNTKGEVLAATLRGLLADAGKSRFAIQGLYPHAEVLIVNEMNKVEGVRL